MTHVDVQNKTSCSNPQLLAAAAGFIFPFLSVPSILSLSRAEMEKVLFYNGKLLRVFFIVSGKCFGFH